MLIFNRFRPGGALHYSPGLSRRRRPGLTNTLQNVRPERAAQHRLGTALTGRRLANTTGLPGRRRIRLALGWNAMAFQAEDSKGNNFLAVFCSSFRPQSENAPPPTLVFFSAAMSLAPHPSPLPRERGGVSKRVQTLRLPPNRRTLPSTPELRRRIDLSAAFTRGSL